MIDGLPALSVRRPVTVIVVFVALCVVGAIAVARIPLQMMPDGFEIPSLWAYIPWPNATPREVETQIVHPVEEQLGTVPGLGTIGATASQNGASFNLEFNRGADMDEAYNAVADRLDRAMADLPDEIERPFLWRFDPSDEPVVWAGIQFAPGTEARDWEIAELARRRLERVTGVARVEAWGVDPRRVFVDFSLDDLVRHRADLVGTVARLAGDNFQVSGGRILDRGRVRYVRSLARWADLDEMRGLPISQPGTALVPGSNGLPTATLDDVADVSHRRDPSADIGRIDGQEGAALALNKESGANTVDTCRRVVAAMRAIEQDPQAAGARFYTFFDQGTLVREALDNLLSSALWGGLLAVAVLLAFLREWRITLVIAACIPFSALLCVAALQATGGSLNLLSLMGLMLAVGMVVDNAIVVIEAIYARRQAGEEERAAAIGGTREVGLAIALSTLTTVIVFLPVILMSEDAIFSFFMGQLGMPVVWALAASLLAALLFAPLATTYFHSGLVHADAPWIAAMIAAYRRSLERILAHRTDALTGAVGLVALTFVVPVADVKCEKESHGNLNDFVIRFEVPPTLSHEERLDVVRTFETYVEEHRDAWGVRVYRSWMRGESMKGRTWVHLLAEQPDGALDRDEVIEAVKDHLPELPGVEAEVGWEGGGGPPPNSLELKLRGEDTVTLESLADEVERRLTGVGGVLGVRVELEEEGSDEVRLVVDREALARHGLGAQNVGRTVGFALRGTSLRDFVDANGNEVDVRAQFRLEDRYDLDRLLDFPVWSTARRTAAPLRAVVRSEAGEGLGPIHREGRATDWPMVVDLEEGVDKDAAKGNVRAALQDMRLPRGYSWDWGLDEAQEAEEDSAQVLAFLLSIVFVFLIMGVLFESLLLPLAVISTVPMAVFGVYWTLYLTGTPLDPMGAVGLVILIGVVVNNGIVLVDLVTKLRADGMERNRALVEAGARRLRPVLMTSLTTIFGLIPMAFGSSSFIGIPYAPLGRVLMGGMIAGTLLTLFYVPFVYTVLDDVRESGRRWWRWVRGEARADAAA